MRCPPDEVSRCSPQAAPGSQCRFACTPKPLVFDTPCQLPAFTGDHLGANRYLVTPSQAYALTLGRDLSALTQERP